MFDVLIIGGSYAGLSAALQLARARRSVAIVDAGQRRNRFAAHSHGFLTQDGTDPAEIAAIARTQVRAYPTVTWHDDKVLSARRVDGGFAADLADGPQIAARRLVLALGVRDELPALPGLAERWGRQIFHCPYCHGYELDQGPIGVLATSPMSIHQAQMLVDWGPTTYFLNGAPSPWAAELADLAQRGVRVEPAPVVALSGEEGLDMQLADGRSIVLAGLFLAPQTSPSSPLAEHLGCAIDTHPTGSFIATQMQQTSVPGIFACGDAARAFGSVALAVGDGAMTGAAVHRSLLFPGG